MFLHCVVTSAAASVASPSCFAAAVCFVPRSASSLVRVASAAASSLPGHVMYSGHGVDGSSSRAATSASASAFCDSVGEIWIDSMYETRSEIDWSFLGPPPTTPQGCIGVPGRP